MSKSVTCNICNKTEVLKNDRTFVPDWLHGEFYMRTEKLNAARVKEIDVCPACLYRARHAREYSVENLVTLNEFFDKTIWED